MSAQPQRNNPSVRSQFSEMFGDFNRIRFLFVRNLSVVPCRHTLMLQTINCVGNGSSQRSAVSRAVPRSPPFVTSGVCRTAS